LLLLVNSVEDKKRKIVKGDRDDIAKMSPGFVQLACAAEDPY
jgi:hypothetical protein